MSACFESGPLCPSTSLTVVMLSVGMLLAVARLLSGPSTPDRVIALELFAMLSVGIIAINVLMTDEPSLLSGGLIFALVSFLGTVAFARYLEKKVSP